jgi:hypothetical protein
MIYNTTTQISGMVSNIRSHDRRMKLAKGVSKTLFIIRLYIGHFQVGSTSRWSKVS